MEARPRAAVVLLVMTVLCPATVNGQDVWDEAEQNIRKLPADSFPSLPAPVRQEMRRLGCVVPQGSDLDHPHNIMAGRFASPDQVDWVFLCSMNGVSSIHVLWGGTERCPTPLGPIDDRSFLQGLGEGVIGFSRRLIAVERDRMLRYRSAFGGPPVPEVWHQGVEDYFEGKASTVLLCVNGTWIKFTGID